MTGGLRSSQVASAAGVNLQTLRYYERRGLVDEPDRSPGGHRLYPPETVTLLRVIKAAQRLGFTLNEVADLLETAGNGHRTRPGSGLRAHVEHKLGDIEQKIADLAVIRDTLKTALAAGCDDLASCAVSPACPLPFQDLADGERRGQWG